MNTYQKYECKKADEAKRTRLGEFCFLLGEAWVKQQAYALDILPSMFDCSLRDCQNAHSVQDVVFEYDEKEGVARVGIQTSRDGGKWWDSDESEYLYFPLWMLKKAAQSGIEYVSLRMIY